MELSDELKAWLLERGAYLLEPKTREELAALYPKEQFLREYPGKWRGKAR